MKRSVRAPFWRRRLLWPCVVLAGANAVVFGAYTLPKSMEKRNVRERLDASRAEVERLRRDVERQRAEVDAVATNARDAEKFYREVVKDRRPELLATVEHIEKTARELGLKPDTWSVSSKTQKDVPVDEVVITMPLSGTYGQLVSFLDKIQRSPRFVTVDEVRLSRAEAGQRPEMEVSFSAFFRPEGGAS